MPRLPPQEGFQSAPLKPPLRIPPMGTTGAASRWSASICAVEREKKLKKAATSALTFTTFSYKRVVRSSNGANNHSYPQPVVRTRAASAIRRARSGSGLNVLHLHYAEARLSEELRSPVDLRSCSRSSSTCADTALRP